MQTSVEKPCRFRIDKLEERIAPSRWHHAQHHHNNHNGAVTPSSQNTSVGVVNVGQGVVAIGGVGNVFNIMFINIDSTLGPSPDHLW
jgi:hypothetical protein